MQPKSFQIFFSLFANFHTLFHRNKTVNHKSSLYTHIAPFFFTYNDVDDHLKNVNSTQSVLQKIIGEQLAIRVEVNKRFKIHVCKLSNLRTN